MNIKQQIKGLAEDFWYTLFPTLCLACSNHPRVQNGHFCVHCLIEMPYTDHFIIKENQVRQKFYGRIDMEFAAAVLYFRTGGMVRNMLHQLKYNREKAVGIVMGNIAGDLCLSSPHFIKPDMMIPIPLHPSKERRRGYNQSFVFGEGVRQVLDIPLEKNILLKTVATDSQTGKTRTERVQNVNSSFKVSENDLKSVKHVLILDDVVTTGATVEAAALALRSAGVEKISVLAIAMAQ